MHSLNKQPAAVSALPSNELSVVASSAKALRLSAMDMQRGLIMIIMAFSHCREYVGIRYYKNNVWGSPSAWLGSSFVDLFEQMFVSTVASGFCMMMGIGMILLCKSRLQEGWSIEKVCGYLIKRGIVLILLQLSVLQFFEIVAEQKVYFYAGVLMMLGACMIIASLCLFLTYQLKKFFQQKSHVLDYLIPTAVIIGIVSLMQIYMSNLVASHAHPSIWEMVFLVGGKFQHQIQFDINFTPIPWFPAVALGLIIGQMLQQHREKAFKTIGMLALSFLGAWFVIRTMNLTDFSLLGSYKLSPANHEINFASYFCTSKYPPSLAYFLWTLGFNLLCMYGFYQAEKYLPKLISLLKPINLFGQCALFFFVMHWFIYYGYSLLLEQKLRMGGSLTCLWLLGLFTLYPMCKAYREFKLTKPADSLWRLF